MAALISMIKSFYPVNDVRLLERAEELKPALRHKVIEPAGGFQLKERYSSEKEEITLDGIANLEMEKGQNLCLDFGSHYVGYLTLHLSYIGSHPDAPAFLKLKFAETEKELSENSEDYDGWISSGWIQEEYIHVDEFPAVVRLSRRYAFRYLKITILDTSPKYKLVVRHAECLAESSAGFVQTPEYMPPVEPLLDKIYEVSLKTLANCMQEVFEDGPKRDRRLWMGDLRLQALTNYVSFQNYDLVKRCLYLFGGSRFPDGRVSACLFTRPGVEADDTWLFDYSLFYAVALEEYLQETDDKEALDDLYDIAMQQAEISLRQCDDYIVSKQAVDHTFVDWGDGLDKTACAQAVLIYALHYAGCLARRKNDDTQADWLMEQAGLAQEAAIKEFWNEERKCFVSGGQVSIASQVWMVLADVLPKEESAVLMGRSEEFMGAYPMATPYMHHYYVMALLKAGLKDRALEHIKTYWGSMIEAGADTFWEAWNPDDPEASPYGSSIINSYCHAWSCTPAYILKKYF